MSAFVLCMSCFSSSNLFLMPFMFICSIMRFLLFPFDCCAACELGAEFCVGVLCVLVRVVCVLPVGPGFCWTSPAFRSSSASHPAGVHGRLPKKAIDRAPISGGG